MPLAKVGRSCGELEDELARTGEPSPETEPDRRVAHEVGDLLFTVVNVAAAPERRPGARAARDESRFVAARRAAPSSSPPPQGERWSELPLDEQDRYYDLAKEQTG